MEEKNSRHYIPVDLTQNIGVCLKILSHQKSVCLFSSVAVKRSSLLRCDFFVDTVANIQFCTFRTYVIRLPVFYYCELISVTFVQ